VKGRERLALLLVLVLGGWCALLAARVAGHERSARAELGRFKLTQLEPATRARLDALQDRVLLTFYVSGRAAMPSSMATFERDATDLMEALAAASRGKLAFQVADPGADEAIAHFAAAAGAAPIRVRSVERDGYSEKTVWSALSIAYGSHPPVTINGLLPERLPRLQSLLVAELDQLEAPRRPVIALAAPAGYDELAAALATRGEVQRVDLDAGAPFPERADLLLWMDPSRVDSARVRELELFLQGGRSAIVAGSEHALVQPVTVDARGEPLLSFRATGDAGAALLSGFGLSPVPGVTCDQWVESLTVDGRQFGLPCVFRSIAPNQDFRTFRGQPNGHLLFSVPTPFRLDAGRLAARGFTAELLASSSDATWIVPQPGAPLPLSQLGAEHGQLAPRQPLLVALRPTDPWGGLLVAAAASTPFRDGELRRAGYAHEALLAVLLDDLVNDARLVQSRVGLDRPAPLPELSAGSRAFWRALCVLLFPAVLLLAAGLVSRGRPAVRPAVRRAPIAPGWQAAPAGEAHASPGARAAMQRAMTAHSAVPAPPTPGWKLRAALLGGGGALAALVIVYAARSGGAQADFSADRLNELSPTTADLAARATGADALVAELWFSPRDRLPPALRPGLSRLTDMLRELQRAGAALDVQVMLPEDLDAAGRAALAAEGIAPVDVTTRDGEVTSVRSVWCSLRLRRAGGGGVPARATVLPFPDAQSLQPLEFRLAFALWRLRTGREPLVGFASDAPRLSAAEAHELYQKRGLIPPQGSDVYALARAAVESWDFRVVHVNPREGALLSSRLDALVWLQPRRPIGEMLQQTVEYLHGGGQVLIAVQHFAMQSRQFPGLAFKLQYWPQPQSADIDTLYFPDLGVELVREPLFDELMAALPLTSMLYEGDSRDVTTMDAALPFFLRVPSANHDGESPVMRNLGDQVLPFASALRLDETLLAQHGLRARTLMTTSPHSWSLAWGGGAIPDDLIAGPPRDEHGTQVWRGRLPLAVELTGQFPLPAERLAPVPEVRDASGAPLDPQPPAPPYPPADLPPAVPGRLLLLGDSELFKNQRMLDPTFRADHLLLNAVASLALPPELAPGLAEVATRRAVARGFELLDPARRLRWRALVLGGFPVAALAFAACWTLLRKRRPGTPGLDARTAPKGDSR